MNSRFGNFARRRPEFEPGFAGAAADTLKMSSEHFQREAGEQSELGKLNLNGEQSELGKLNLNGEQSEPGKAQLG